MNKHEFGSFPFTKRAGSALLILMMLILSPLVAHSQDDEDGFPLQLGSGGADQGFSVVLDSQRNVYVAGIFQNTMIVEEAETSTETDTALISEGAFDIFVAKYNANAQLQWARSAGGTGNDTAWSLALDSSNNVYVAGEFSGDATFFDDPELDEDENNDTTLTSAGNTDIFIAKYNSNGELQWAKSAGGSRADSARGIAIDNMGNGVITGAFRGAVRFDNLRVSAPSNTSSAYVAKFNPDGRWFWVEPGTGDGNLLGTAIDTDNQGNIYAIGEFFGDATFGETELNTAGENDVFIVKYDPMGELDWAERGGGIGDDAANAISAEPNGDFYITGSIGAEADFDGTDLSYVGGLDIYVAHYNASGSIQWATSAGSGGSDVGSGISFSDGPMDGVIVTGRFERTWTLDNNVLGSAGGSDIFLFRYDLDGELVWTRTAGGTGSDGARAVATDNMGVSLVTGYFTDSAEFDGVSRSSVGGLDAFIVRYDMFGFLLP